MNRYSVATELFELRDGTTNLIYAPLLGITCSTDNKLKNVLCDVYENIRSSENYEHQYQHLLKMGFIIDKTKKDTLKRAQPPALSAPFLPCEATLFLTSNCNLNCKYCYGNGGSRKERMSESIAYASADLIVENAKKLNQNKISLSFHGGGEPTLEISLMKKVVEYTRRISETASLQCEFGLTTNGVVSSDTTQWIIDNITHLNLSFDGPEDIQNHQRPFQGGKGSFSLVSNTLEELDKAQKHYCIRGTVTQYCENRIPEIADFITSHFKVGTLQLEPMFSVGRAIETAMTSPDPKTFIKGYLEAEDICQQRNVMLKFSGHRYPGTSFAFCGIGRKNFAVTPEGFVTSCFEVLENVDDRSEFFFFGEFSGDSFNFNEEKIKTLRISSETIPNYCKNCFAQFHCTGDCRGKGLYIADMNNYKGGGRCEIIQGLIQEKIFNHFSDKSSGAEYVKGE